MGKMGGDEYKEEDDMKNGDFLSNVEPMKLHMNSHSANIPTIEHSRRRSNSFHSPSSPAELPAKYMGAYNSAMSTGSTSTQSVASSRSTLSPVCEPVTESKSEHVTEPVSEPVSDYANIITNGDGGGRQKKN